MKLLAKNSEIYEALTGKTVARTDIGGRDEKTDQIAILLASAPIMLETLITLKEKIEEQQRTVWGNLDDLKNSMTYQMILSAIESAKP